jgi:2-desacetyl-2-hydroxyethyl bacteriochlorophyllide A dehydrogenase
MNSNCIIFRHPLQVELGEIDLPAPGPGQVLSRTLFTGVSTGTETRVLRGGETDKFPLIPGYENVGQVVLAGPGVDFKPGDIIYHSGSEYTGAYTRCWGAQMGLALTQAVNCLAVPPGLEPARALYVKVGGIALHGINRARVTAVDTVAVVGLGLIGHLAAQCARARGARVIAIDTDESRRDIARAAGFVEVLNPREGNLEARVKEISSGGVDVAIDVTGVAAVADQTARLVRPKPWHPPYPPSARVVLLGSYTEPVAFSYHPTLFANEPDILPSRDVTPADLQEMLGLLASGQVNPGFLPAKTYPVASAPQAYSDLMANKLLRIVFDWRTNPLATR